MRICLVCSHGGHLTEMNELLPAFEGHNITVITYKSERTRSIHGAVLVDNLAEKPSYLARGVLAIIVAILRLRPDFIVSTGSEIAVPAFLVGKILGSKTMFVESCARITSPSMTGRIVYPISDFFFVQWKALLPEYGAKARYVGGLI